MTDNPTACLPIIHYNILQPTGFSHRYLLRIPLNDDEMTTENENGIVKNFWKIEIKIFILWPILHDINILIIAFFSV